MATIRSSDPFTVTSTPVRCGLVSSREAERATRPITSTKAAAGTFSESSGGGSGSLGKSSGGRVRRWNTAPPETTSTSCCEERYSSERSSRGSERTTSSNSRPGMTTEPSVVSVASSDTRTPSSMSVASSSSVVPETRRCTPARVWIALRVETPRTATPSLARNVSRETESFN